MDSFELSKIAGAIFAALLLIFIPKTIIEMRKSAHEAGTEGYQLPTPAAEAPAPAADAPAADTPAGGATAVAPGEPGAAPAAAPAGFDAKAVVAMIASASADSGKSAFSKCGACHTAQKDAANKVGPNLWNVVGRGVASKDGFNYSAALKGKGGTWDLEHLATFVHKPSVAVPGTKMVFPGIKDSAAIADLLAYMRTLGDNPAPLPK